MAYLLFIEYHILNHCQIIFSYFIHIYPVDMENITGVKSNKRRGGIYKIVNTSNGKYYIGSSNHIYRRCRRHKNDLINNCHDNCHLQNAWNKYGKSSFDFYIIEDIINENDLLIREQYYIDVSIKENIYNLHLSAERLFLTDEHKKKISNTLKGRPKSLEARRKQSISVTGENNSRYGIPQNSKKYTFFHPDTNQMFTGTQLEFTNRYNMKSGTISQLALGKRKSSWGWKILSNL